MKFITSLLFFLLLSFPSFGQEIFWENISKIQKKNPAKAVNLLSKRFSIESVRQNVSCGEFIRIFHENLEIAHQNGIVVDRERTLKEIKKILNKCIVDGSLAPGRESEEAGKLSGHLEKAIVRLAYFIPQNDYLLILFEALKKTSNNDLSLVIATEIAYKAWSLPASKRDEKFVDTVFNVFKSKIGRREMGFYDLLAISFRHDMGIKLKAMNTSFRKNDLSPLLLNGFIELEKGNSEGAFEHFSQLIRDHEESSVTRNMWAQTLILGVTLRKKDFVDKYILKTAQNYRGSLLGNVIQNFLVCYRQRLETNTSGESCQQLTVLTKKAGYRPLLVFMNAYGKSPNRNDLENVIDPQYNISKKKSFLLDKVSFTK